VSDVVLFGDVNVVLDVVVDHAHLYLIVDDVGGKIPESGFWVSPLVEFMELPERLLSEVIPVEFQGDQILIGLQRLSDHLEAIIVDVVSGEV
jgi:hypothetical protein